MITLLQDLHTGRVGVRWRAGGAEGTVVGADRIDALRWALIAAGEAAPGREADVAATIIAVARGSLLGGP